jgi:hypothetical protein
MASINRNAHLYPPPIEEIIGDGKSRSALKDVEKVEIYAVLHEAIILPIYVDFNRLYPRS